MQPATLGTIAICIAVGLTMLYAVHTVYLAFKESKDAPYYR